MQSQLGKKDETKSEWLMSKTLQIEMQIKSVHELPYFLD